MKSIAMVLSLAVSGIAVSGTYSSALASKMNGRGGMCSDGAGCMSDKAKNHMAGKPKMAKPKTGN